MRVRWHDLVNWKKAEAAGSAVSRRALKLTAEKILADSAQEVPLEEGTLLRSGSTSVNSAGDEATISYDTPYAVVQHESMDFTHDAGRKAKYLEDPLHANADTFQRVLAKVLREEF